MTIATGLRWIALAAVGVAAGCSDSDGSGGDSEARPSYADLIEEAEALDERTVDLFLTDPADLPSSGSAQYDGVLAMATDGAGGAPTDFLGELTLAVDFGDDGLSGGATNFVTSDEEQLDGSLTISNGDIDRNTDPVFEPTYTYDLDGTLTDDDGTDFEVAAGVEGAFLGDDAEATIGFLGGVMASEDGTAELGGVYLAD